MWSRKSQAAKKLTPILDKESSKTSNTEWLRYKNTINQITTLITGFELTDEQTGQIKKKMSEETSQAFNRDSVCRIKAMDVRTDNWYYLTVMKKSEDKLVLDWSNCDGCDVGTMIDFDFENVYWKGDYYGAWDGVFYAISLV